MQSNRFSSALAALAATAPAWAQGSSIQSPGMPAQTYPAQGQAADPGQSTRFSSVFNPAFSFIVDAAFDYTDPDDTDDGFDATLRVFELGANAWVDPNAWAYFIGAADEEELTIEEAAVHYVGLGGNHTIRAGRFFIDFGKQMQTHVHELRTLERPLVLRTYLGEEVEGDGLQWDSWTSVGESTVLRWSLGGFANLLPEYVEDIDPLTQAAQEVTSPKDLQDFNFTARVTGLRDVGEHGLFQLGASARAIPSYDFVYEPTGVAEDDLTNVVYGLDATYGWVDDTGLKRWTFGGEVLANTGDNGSVINDPNGTPGDGDETIQVLDDAEIGYFAFGDYAWDRYHSAGLQFSAAELPDGSDSDELEVEAYFTRLFSEFHRLRFVLAQFESDANEDAWRAAVQYTATLGAHGHGINW
jgi:hypothetical protein